jgi:dinuclear metal center YbgI/SA1388 family protein
MTTDASSTATVADVMAAMAARYPPDSAAEWDRVGLVVGDPAAPVRRILLAVDCVAETVAHALRVEADVLLVHHPLLLRGVHSVATISYKGTAVHTLILAGVSLLVAHTNADVAAPGVSDALAARLELTNVRPMVGFRSTTGGNRHPGRIGELYEPMSLAAFTTYVAQRLPVTAAGVRAAGDPDREIRSVAVCGGAGDSFLADATASGVDAYLTADLRHHPASEHLANGGPALLDAAHWATERPWLDALAGELRGDIGVEVVVCDLVTDVWTVHARGAARPAVIMDTNAKELRP